jgi:hypothetical protein
MSTRLGKLYKKYMNTHITQMNVNPSLIKIKNVENKNVDNKNEGVGRDVRVRELSAFISIRFQ